MLRRIPTGRSRTDPAFDEDEVFVTQHTARWTFIVTALLVSGALWILCLEQSGPARYRPSCRLQMASYCWRLTSETA